MEKLGNSEKKSILDIFIFILQRKKYLSIIIAFSIILAVILFAIIPVKYVSNCKIFPDIGNSENVNLNQFSKLGKMMGMNLGATGQGAALLSVAYTDLIKSREVLLDVIHDTIATPSNDDTVKIIEYMNRKSIPSYIFEYTIGLISKLKMAFIEAPSENKETDRVIYFSNSENIAINKLAANIAIEKDIETGIITIGLTSQNAEVSALLNDRLLHHFENRVREIYAMKNIENFHFFDKIYNEANTELNNAENILANFLIKNSNLQKPTLQIQLERLQRNLDVKTSMFTDVQTKLTNIKITLKRNEPVIILIEKPNVPREKSGFGVITIFTLTFIIVLILYFLYFYGKYYLSVIYQHPADKEKVQKMIGLIKGLKVFKIFRRY